MNDCSPDPAPAIWLCDIPSGVVAGVPEWMTADERHRLNKLTGSSRNEFLASRWLIRRALAAASGLPADQCHPTDARATESAEPRGWRLSISHSQGLAGCAISKAGALGLDVEPVSRRPQWRKVSARWFSPIEQAWLNAENDPESFLRVWTLKEAWLKATGRGIADNLQTLEVSRSFELLGDQPGESWWASLGYTGGFLVSVVYRGDKPPDGRRLSGPLAFDDSEITATEALPIEWIFHRQIGFVSGEA